jgi:hypothetical protein
MGKMLKLATRAFGAEPGVPDVTVLAAWVGDHRGVAADLNLYLLDQSLAPQIAAEIDVPCGGGKFCKDLILESLIGLDNGKATGELDVCVDIIIEDAVQIAVQKKGVWFALPAPHALDITDTYYNDEDEWGDAVAGMYRTIMRAMRDAGIAGHVLICDKAEEAEISALVRQKVFFFEQHPDRESLEILMEHQRRIAAGKDQLAMVFEIAHEYELQQIMILDADNESIEFALTHLDPDRIMVGGYCTDACQTYWKCLVESSRYST